MLAALHVLQIQTALQDIFAIKILAAVNYHHQTNALQALPNSKSVATVEQNQEYVRAMECGALTEHATIRENARQELQFQMDAAMQVSRYAARAVITALARMRENAVQDSKIQFHADFAGIKQEHANQTECGVLLVHAQIQEYAVPEQPHRKDVLWVVLRDVQHPANTADAQMKEFAIQELLNQNRAGINVE